MGTERGVKLWWRMGLAAAVLLAGALAAWWLLPRPAVEVVAARRDRIVQYIDERGVTRLEQTYAITMPASGRIAAIGLLPGTRVSKGQIVAEMVQADLDLAVAEAEAALARLDAAIRHGSDTALEETAARQAEKQVEAMRSASEAAEARAAASRAHADFANKQFRRVKRLAETGASTEDELDRATLEQVQSQITVRQDSLFSAAVRSLQAASELLPLLVRQYIDRKRLEQEVLRRQRAEVAVRLEQARLARSRGKLASPVDGVVLRRLVSTEGFQPAGALLLEIGRLEDLEIETEVLTVEAVRIRPGQPALVYGPAVGDEPARAVVRYVEPAAFTKISSLGVEQQRVKVILRLEPHDLNRLLRQQHVGLGYRVRVRIETAARPQALVVPRLALFRSPQGNWQVVAVRQGRTQIVDVAVGLLNDEHAEILSGIEENEWVVAMPEASPPPGSRVRPVLVSQPETAPRGIVDVPGQPDP